MTFVTDETFDEVVGKSAIPVLFVMGATWCPDCQRIAPLMMMLAKENAGKILFVHADFDSAQGLKVTHDFFLCLPPKSFYRFVVRKAF